jgi:hypothetical protein
MPATRKASELLQQFSIAIKEWMRPIEISDRNALIMHQHWRTIRLRPRSGKLHASVMVLRLQGVALNGTRGMNEQRQAQFSLGEGGIGSVSPAAIDAHDGRRKRCVQCGGPFGLMRRRRAGKQFCSQKCADQHADGVRKAVAVRARWYAFLYQRR